MASSWSPPMVFKLSKINYTVEWDRKQWWAWGQLISSTVCAWSTLLCILPKELDCRFWKGHHLVAKITLNAPGARFGSQPVFTGRNRPGRLWELWQQLVWFQNALTAVDFSYGDFGKSLKSREDWVFLLIFLMYICTFSHTWNPKQPV